MGQSGFVRIVLDTEHKLSAGLKTQCEKGKKRGHFVTHNTCFPGATTNVLEFSQLETCLSLLLKVA